MTVLRSPLRPVLRSPLYSPLVGKWGGAFSPSALFQTGDILLWYDPSDLSTMFKDTAGTQPVTADGDSVALILDKGQSGYHRVQATGTSMPKYKTDGTLHWLLYDGSDDGNSTPSINWGTDEVAICAGLTKSSDAAIGVFAELGNATGNFGLYSPITASSNVAFRSRGTVISDTVATGIVSPVTAVLTGRGKISTDLATLRLNGSQAASSSSDQGTGVFGNYPLYFGRRTGASLPFNGKEYQTVIRNRLLSAGELASLETFVAGKTGVTL